MRRLSATLLVLLLSLSAHLAVAGNRVPTDQWMRYASPRDAGFDPGQLQAAYETWEGLPSSAFMVIADGAVVASWGDVERRFMCHSVRKSFLAALYGIYWDRGEIELNKTLADLGIDDEPDSLLDSEQQARILDLLKARSGVFHPAAYAGRTDSRPRGSEGPGRYFAYNNWDFNTLAAILMQETGDDVFESFDTHFGRPLGMEDWRVSDGYYHYERDKSKYPAYPFRLSARDAARFGLLHAREGLWGDQRILSRNWVRRSSAMYSIDSDIMGYGFMWWVFREPRFQHYGMYAALGVGNQMIAVLPELDMVIVNRANTYEGEGTPMEGLLDLIEQVLEARTGAPRENPRLEPLPAADPDPRITHVASAQLNTFVGEWPLPPAPLGLPSRASITLTAGDGHLVTTSETRGTFSAYVQDDGSIYVEDSRTLYYPVRDNEGAFAGAAPVGAVVAGALNALIEGDVERGQELMALIAEDESVDAQTGRAVATLLRGDSDAADRAIASLAEETDPRQVEAGVNALGYLFLQGGHAEPARDVFLLNTRAFPDAANAWDSLGEAHMTLGADAEAIRCYEKSLELNERNTNAVEMIQRIKEKSPEN